MNILFLCTGNSCRSQMAEAWAKKLIPEHQFFSAGTKAQGLNPLAVRVMEEVDLDLSTHRSQNLDDLKQVDFDLVITVCSEADESCPRSDFKKVLHRSFDDPPALTQHLVSDEEKLPIYRRVRDEIKNFIENHEF